MPSGCKEERVLTDAEWGAEHRAHGSASRVLAAHQPPRGTYRLYEVICPCGAVYITTVDPPPLEKGE